MNFLIKDQGFSLVEVLIGAAGIGVVALALMNLTNNHAKNQANIEAKFSTQELKQIITNLFYDKAACTNTLAGSSIGSEINQLRNAANESVYVKNGVYGGNNLTISSLRTLDKNQPLSPNTRLVDLIVTFRKNKVITHQSNLAVTVPLKVTAPSASGVIVDCLSYDDKFVQKAGDVMSGALIATQLNATNNVTASGTVQGQRICTNGVCKVINDFVVSNQFCPPNQYLDGIQGAPRCRSFTFSCPPGQVIRAINSNGSVACAELIPPSCPAQTFSQDGITCTIPSVAHGQTSSCSGNQPGECKWGHYGDRGAGWGWKCKATGSVTYGGGSGGMYRCLESCRGDIVTITKLCFKGAWQ
ncbi:type II secretion system protein [Peredibacter sp. HCB2-198]|uniref:type II secretion system protein n=1 Tax=Peredibacter sp. HCB2-198 TaxID=3383025 RepID=UPI0038B53174